MTPTASFYLFRATLNGFALFAAIGVALIAIIDFVEQYRLFGDQAQATPLLLLGLTFTRLPGLFESALPFVILLGAVWAFARMNRRAEIVALRASGLSVNRMAAPAVAAAIVCGLTAAAVLNPISAAFQSLGLRIVTELDGRARAEILAFQGSAVWLREGREDGRSVIRADAVSDGGRRLDGVLLLEFDADQRFRRRIDASDASLDAGAWTLRKALVTEPDRGAERRDAIRVPTAITLDDLRTATAPPESLSIWRLPEFIRNAERAGIAVDRHRYTFHRLIATPAFFAAMTVLAVAVSTGHQRSGGAARLTAFGVGLGFAFYFVVTLAEALAEAGAAAPALAAWSPAAVALLFGAAALLHADEP